MDRPSALRDAPIVVTNPHGRYAGIATTGRALVPRPTRRPCSRSARVHVERHPSIEVEIDAIHAVYASLLE